MRVLVAGATGVLGRALLPLLRERGHEVVPLGVDLLDRTAVVSAVRSVSPDVVVHQASALRHPRAFEQTARLRAEGTAGLLAAGVGRLVAHSIAFATAPEGPAVLGEDAPLYLDAPDPGWATTTRAVAALESSVAQAAGTVLRLGTLYGPGTQYAADGAVGSALARGRYRQPAGADGVTSFVHVEDAARATALAIESEVPGTFNITDDSPALGSEWLPGWAGLLGGPVPRTIPADIASRLLGWFPTYQLTRLRGASNERARQALGWKPRFPDWQAGNRH
ncbi:NAD(P)-dependent oxidoreductase [Lentzea sp.]|uniref:NAD-dependent epimerase/dehydratase family protein n=1 Tax=Lentzea sp. TaxID=56099 RepID=UPI002B5E002C|nr:NAD(P)-dependent oxidoreductase [Lentzea sp.]HUQ58562.1 NAD(P)-dependent oxidoreductase [Lentzea sp.]